MSPQTAKDLARCAEVTTTAAARRFIRRRGVWARLTERWAELIVKDVTGGLTSPAEVAEYQALQTESERLVALAFPRPIIHTRTDP